MNCSNSIDILLRAWSFVNIFPVDQLKKQFNYLKDRKKFAIDIILAEGYNV